MAWQLAGEAAPHYPAPGVYEPPRQTEPGGCGETWLITRAIFAVLLPIMLVMIGMLGALVITVALFAAHPALALLPVAALVLAGFIFARWERRRYRPPGA